MDKRSDLILAGVVLAFGLSVLVLTRFQIDDLQVAHDPIGSRGFAYVMGIYLTIGATIVLVSRIRALRRTDAPGEPAEGTGDDLAHPASGLRALAVMLLAFAYMLGMSYVGYLVATLPFVYVALRIMMTKIRFPFLYSVGYTVLTFLVFGVALSVRLPMGPLERGLRSLGVL